MAASPQPTKTPQLGAVSGPFKGLSASTSPNHGSDLGKMTVSRTSGGAGWWKSPSPDLVGASAGKPAGATRHHLTAKKRRTRKERAEV